MVRSNWMLQSLFVALGTMAVLAIATALPIKWGAILVVCCIVFFILYFHNPVYYYRRLASLLIHSWIGAAVISNIYTGFGWGKEYFGYIIVTGFDWKFHLITLCLIVLLLSLDILQCRRHKVAVQDFVQHNIHKNSLRVYIGSPLGNTISPTADAIRTMIFQNFDNFLPLVCTKWDSQKTRGDTVRSADVFVFVLNEYLEQGEGNADGEGISMGVFEYETAKKHRLNILSYSDATVSPVSYPGHDQFVRSVLTHARHRTYSDNSELPKMIEADLKSLFAEYKSAVEQERDPELIIRHREVCDVIDRGDLQRAKTMNDRLLDEHPFSPRAHYNQACILCRMAEQRKKTKAKENDLVEARLRLADAVNYGFIDVLSKARDKGIGDPVEVILKDPDLRMMFEIYPEMDLLVRNKSGFFIRPHAGGGGGGGCACGCTSADGHSIFQRRTGDNRGENDRVLTELA